MQPGLRTASLEIEQQPLWISESDESDRYSNYGRRQGVSLIIIVTKDAMEP